MKRPWGSACELAMMIFFSISCSKSGSGDQPVVIPPKPMTLKSILLDNGPFNNPTYNVSAKPVIKMQFSQPVLHSSVANSVTLIGRRRRLN